MTESQPKPTTTKMKERQERAGFEATIRLQEQLDEEERQRVKVHQAQSNVPSSSVEDEAIIKEMLDGLVIGNTIPASERASRNLNELTELCTKLFAKVTSLEDELTCTKVVYNKAFITLTKRVKKLEKRLKHKKRRAVINSSEDEEPILDVEDSPKQGRMIVEIDKDENINLVKSSEKEEAHASAEHIMESELDDDDTTLTKIFLNI
ncbi:hypothetical protein Tco_1134616 [Tanacetum coccineum]